MTAPLTWSTVKQVVGNLITGVPADAMLTYEQLQHLREWWRTPNKGLVLTAKPMDIGGPDAPLEQWLTLIACALADAGEASL